jgi:CBS domain-containing protein
MRAREIMSSPVVTIRPEASAKQAAALLAERGFTSLPVVADDGRLVGVVTEADLLRDRIGPDARALVHPDWPVPPPPQPPPATVAGLMTTELVTGTPSTDVAELAKRMLDEEIRLIPIVRDGELVGVVTKTDLLRLIARDDDMIARDIRHRLALSCGRQTWDVSVVDGVATIAAEEADETDRHVAGVVAQAVPGVLRVRVAGSVETADAAELGVGDRTGIQ